MRTFLIIHKLDKILRYSSDAREREIVISEKRFKLSLEIRLLKKGEETS